MTKGLRERGNGELEPFPHYWQGLVENRLSINAIGGPCTSYELADRRRPGSISAETIQKY